ncbi:hypothetical protein GFS24_17410 [Chitinophaga sp. SYP-B3965]|uniref:hypothetical protein n=1 Tax=Chitinophaga sp. SYP-B3965 TaxID=2663120 RepID=UPI0012998E78|nr:hypothetical protein [Chitinophaga sp. SYP-B3965]MRG46903.1 hypothetical protein [Chitinophaga sp. SYP-B3965]
MIISTNKSYFVNPTTASAGNLRTYGTSITGANEVFMAFKPSTFCKKSGFLSIKGCGYLVSQLPNTVITIDIDFARPGIRTINMPILYAPTGPNQADGAFTFQVDIPVGTSVPPVVNHAFVTGICRMQVNMYEAGPVYMNADADDIWTATFRYIHTNGPLPISVGEIQILSVIAEYKEN